MTSRRIGFIGLGLMGWPMATSLRRAGFELTVFNRTTSTAERFAAEHGAQLASDPAALAAEVELIITMVVDGPQVRDLLVAAADRAAPGTLCIDCSTIGPRAAREIGAELAGRGLRFIDAPVTGSLPGARDGTLTIMVGASPADLEDARPVLAAMGSRIVHAGPLGDGQAVKVISNAVAAANTVTLAEALLAGRAAGLDLDALVAVMDGGAAASRMLTLRARPMIEHDFTPLFRLDHMLKDVLLCLEDSPAFASAERTVDDLQRARQAGHGDEDLAAVIDAVAERSQ